MLELANSICETYIDCCCPIDKTLKRDKKNQWNIRQMKCKQITSWLMIGALPIKKHAVYVNKAMQDSINKQH